MDQIAQEAPPGPEPSPASPRVPFPSPADYYSEPRSARPIVAPWVPFGCGSAAVILLVVVFLGGIVISRGGMGSAFDLLLGSIQDEVEKMFTKDVTPAEKAQFEVQMKSLRQQVRQNRVPIERLQPLLRSVREAGSDQHITPVETEELIKELQEANKTAKP